MRTLGVGDKRHPHSRGAGNGGTERVLDYDDVFVVGGFRVKIGVPRIDEGDGDIVALVGVIETYRGFRGCYAAVGLYGNN